MGMGDHTSAITVFLSKPNPAVSLALVALGDGSLAIQRNGELVEGCRWKLAETEEAVTVYRDVLARFKAASAGCSPPNR